MNENKKTFFILILGVALCVIARLFKIHYLSAYTIGGLLVFTMAPVISYAVILFLVSFVISLFLKNKKRSFFVLFSWLFFAAGIFDIAASSFTEFYVRPQVLKIKANSDSKQTQPMNVSKQIAMPQDRSANTTRPALQYSTEGNPKAKGLNITLEYPESWIAAEGERPNIVQKFSQNLEPGVLLDCLIMIKDIPDQFTDISEKEMADDIFSNDGIQMMLGSGAELLENVPARYDGQIGARSSFVERKNRAGLEFYSHTLQHIFILKKKIVCIQCSIGGMTSDSEKIDRLYEENLLSFIKFGGSVVQEKW